MNGLAGTRLLHQTSSLRTSGHRPFGFANMLATLVFLSPVCAVSGMMLAQILGLVSY